MAQIFILESLVRDIRIEIYFRVKPKLPKLRWSC
jgi:hypothetical protein